MSSSLLFMIIKKSSCLFARYLNLESNSIHYRDFDAKHKFSLLYINLHKYSNFYGLALLLPMHYVWVKLILARKQATPPICLELSEEPVAIAAIPFSMADAWLIY